MDETLTTIAGRAIRALRKQRHCTIGHVASVTGLSLSYVSEVERGRATISLDLLGRIAAALEVSPLALLGVDTDERARRVRAEERLSQIVALAAQEVR